MRQFAACVSAGNAAAVKQLVRERAGKYGKTLLQKVWGVRKDQGALVLPEQAAADNPLLAIMWARFQESCRLSYASGAFFCALLAPPVCWSQRYSKRCMQI